MKAWHTPLLLYAVPAIILSGLATRITALPLVRVDVARGALWQLYTGHWVHFSLSHLCWNLLVLMIAGTWLERVQPGRLVRFTAMTAPLISVAVLLAEPGLRAYGGLSALACGVVVLAARERLRTPGSARLEGVALLAAVACKSLHDVLRPAPMLASFHGPAIQLAASAHAVGALMALLYAAAARRPPSAPGNKTAGTHGGFPAARFRSSQRSGDTHTNTGTAHLSHARAARQRFHSPRKNVTSRRSPGSRVEAQRKRNLGTA